MNILAIYTQNTRASCLESIEQIKSLDIPFDTHSAELFSSINIESVTMLDEYTHFIIAPESGAEAAWVTLLCAYALGAQKPLYIAGGTVSGFIAEIFPTENIFSFFRIEKDKFLFEEGIRKAREELAKSGIAFHTDAFCSSVEEGALKAVELFLTAGFSPDARNRRGVPAISLAIRGQHRSIVSRLLEHNVEINVISDDRGNTPVMDAAACGDIEMVRMLIGAGADLNVVSKNGQTALILAVGQESEETALVLIEAGADVAIKDHLGMSAASYAKMFGKKKILECIGE